MMCWVMWERSLEVRNMYGEVIGHTMRSGRFYEWRPELALEGGW